MCPQWWTQCSHSPASASPRQPSPPSHRREETGAQTCLTSVKTRLHVTWKHTHTRILMTLLFPQNEFHVSQQNRHSFWVFYVRGKQMLAGVLGALMPCCLDLNLAHQYGECLCMPLLPGSTFAMRVGMRERYKIRVSAHEETRQKQKDSGQWEIRICVAWLDIFECTHSVVW